MKAIRRNSKEAEAVLQNTNINWFSHGSECYYKASEVSRGFVIDQYKRFRFSKMFNCEKTAAPINYIVKITSSLWFQGIIASNTDESL